MMRVLIAAREVPSSLEGGLRADGYTTKTAATVAQALAHAHGDPFDLLILDDRLPGMEDVDLVRKLRTAAGHPAAVILIAADPLAGLHAEVDDFLTTPFSREELLARVRRILKDPASSHMVLRAGRVALDLRSRRACVGDREVELTTREFTLLETFLRRPGETISREELLEAAWGEETDAGSNVVDVYVRYLRRKLGDDVVETVRGVGYRLPIGEPG